MSGKNNNIYSTPSLLLTSGATLLLLDYIERKWMLSADADFALKYLKSSRVIRSYYRKNFTVADFWEERSSLEPHKVCLVFEGQSYTFLDIEKASNRMAHYFLSKGIKSKDIVAIYMENRPEFIITWLALSKIGAISSLLNCNQRGVPLVRSIEVCEAKTLIYGTEIADRVSEVLDELVSRGLKFFCEGVSPSYGDHLNSTILNYPVTRPPKSLRDGLTTDDIWGFVFTSGTTGYPKASVITHLKIIAISCFFSIRYSINKNDRMYSPLPLYHTSAGLLGVGVTIFARSTLVIRKKFSASDFWRDVIENDCTIFQYSGELCRYLLALPESNLDKQHRVRIAVGNGLRPDVWTEFQKRFNIPYIGEFYASTEGNASITHIVKQNGEGVGAVGIVGPISRMISGVKLVKCNVDTGELERNRKGFCIECKPGEVGELLGLIHDQVSNFSGYHGNSKGTNERIAFDVFNKGDKYFRTGDLLRKDERGYFYFVDRMGDNYRWKGENISSNEVAEVIASFKDLQQVNVYGIQLPKADGRVGMAAIVPKEPGIDLESFSEYVCRELPAYAIPVFVRIMNEIKTTDTLKYRKVDLRNEGINKSIKDPIYFFNHQTKKYEPLNENVYQTIMSGKAKL